MKRNWVKPISCALALALTVGSFPGSVLAATSAQQAFEMTVQSVMEAANVTTDVVKLIMTHHQQMLLQRK